MRIYQTKDYEEMSRRAADVVAAQVIMKPESVLGLATGSTPVGMYRELVCRYQKGNLDFSEVRTVNLDEYRGLRADDEQSYSCFMRKHFFSQVNIRDENTNIPDGRALDAAQECTRYEKQIAALGGIDLQVLGLGHNGHIGFNEPGDAFEVTTHLVDLAESTIQANRRFFEREEDVPRQAYTMGIRTIMQARKIVLMVSGEEKAEILYEALCGPVTPRVPASILQLHGDLVVVADAGAAGRLSGV